MVETWARWISDGWTTEDVLQHPGRFHEGATGLQWQNRRIGWPLDTIPVGLRNQEILAMYTTFMSKENDMVWLILFSWIQSLWKLTRLRFWIKCVEWFELSYWMRQHFTHFTHFIYRTRSRDWRTLPTQLDQMQSMLLKRQLCGVMVVLENSAKTDGSVKVVLFLPCSHHGCLLPFSSGFAQPRAGFTKQSAATQI